MITTYRFKNRYDSAQVITIQLVRENKPTFFNTHYDWAETELEMRINLTEDASYYDLIGEEDSG
jgi:hypothetical protein